MRTLINKGSTIIFHLGDNWASQEYFFTIEHFIIQFCSLKTEPILELALDIWVKTGNKT